jgi:hypothetical protein
MPIFSDPETRKYLVVKVGDGWAVERGGQTLYRFASRETAMAHARQSAQEDAERGWLGLAAAETPPEEIHCFTPSRKDAARCRSRPRLVSSR